MNTTNQLLIENSRERISKMVRHESNKRHLERLLLSHRIAEYKRDLNRGIGK